MFFHKKKQLGPVPPGEVQKLTASGMSDKDVIKHFKSRGYPYEEIEKALMSAVKRSIASEQPQFAPYSPFQQEQKSQLPEVPELSEYRPEEKDMMAGLEATEPDISADIIVEEIVEGVVDEKWQKFEEKVKKIESDFVNLGTQLRQLEQKQPAAAQPAKDYDSKISDMSEQIEDLQARVGGLEKAFKQFLPSLTKNIESLSNLIHEMKEKHAVTQEA